MQKKNMQTAKSSELSKEELMHEWRQLTTKRNALWSKGLEFAPEDELALARVRSAMNPHNKGR